ncbi:hypothetical protein HD554DRAFT_2174067 [Boletus coccyginus]|nr:hypothetical protein HD554DRAFT_2174067 [Boletus coccyginus]
MPFSFPTLRTHLRGCRAVRDGWLFDHGRLLMRDYQGGVRGLNAWDDCGIAGFWRFANMRQPCVFKFSLDRLACGLFSCYHNVSPWLFYYALKDDVSNGVFVEQLLRSPQLVYPTIYHYNFSAAQTLASLRDEVQHLREAEHRLQRQIHRYRSSLEEIQTVLYAKVNKANEMQNFLAAISRLPNEILLAIFEEAVACQDPGVEQRAEFTISKVSRRWRDLAINSPRLWRRVWIAPRVAPSMLEMYKTRASRALDIEIWGWRDRRDFQRFDTALETMVDSSGRWRSLSIACVCDTNLSHLTLKLSHVGHFSGLRHFTFRALRPGQTCSVSFLMESATTTQPHSPRQILPSCMLKSLDVENFMLTGDLGSIHTRATQSFARLSSLTLRRYSNDARSFRIMIDFGAFRAMLGGIPNLTTLILHGQPLRFRTDPIGGQDDAHGSGVGSGNGAPASTAAVSLPQLQTLVLHPGVLKPRYLQHTISAIHAPALRHFELVFPDSKISGQSIVERLFVDASPSGSSFSSLSSSASSYGSYPSSSSSSATGEHMNRRYPRFPRVETVVLHNTSNAGTALAFIHAFPCTTQATLGGVDVGFFPLVLSAGARSSVVATGAGTSVGIGPMGTGESPSRSGIVGGSGSRSGTSTCDGICTRFASWHRLRTLMLRQPRPETLRVLLDWIRNEYERGHVIPMLIVEGSLDRPDIRFFAQCARACTRVELVGMQVPITAVG